MDDLIKYEYKKLIIKAFNYKLTDFKYKMEYWKNVNYNIKLIMIFINNTILKDIKVLVSN